MAELKPVPKGYDENALGSMLSYLANARKSHEGNALMRGVLDTKADRQLEAYLSDADLTRSAQMDDNEYSQSLNLAKLLDDSKKWKTNEANTLLTNTGQATAPLENIGGQVLSDEANQTLLKAFATNKAMAPAKTRSEIELNDSSRDENLLGLVKTKAEVGHVEPVEDFRKQSRTVVPDLAKSLSAISSAAQGRDAARETITNQQTAKRIGPHIVVRENGKLVTKGLTDEEAKALSDKGHKVGYGEYVDQASTSNTTTTHTPNGQKGNSEDVNTPPPKPAVKAVTDIERAKRGLDSLGVKYDGIKQDANGNVLALVDGKWEPINEE